MPSYWFDVFTVETWEEARAQGFRVSGFSESKYATVKRIQVGDFLICYLKGAKKLVGALRVVEQPYFSHEPRIWSNASFPARVNVEPIAVLAEESGLDFLTLLTEMSVYDATNLKSTWARFQGSPTHLSQSDGELLFAALMEHQSAISPIRTPSPPLPDANKPRAVTRSQREIDFSPIPTSMPAIKVLSDPLSTLIEELTKAQRDAAHPGRFEQAVADAFQYLGLDATRYGQPNKTDVVVNSQLGHDRFRVVIDAKASSSGKVPEGQINWTAVSSHRQQAGADFATIVGEKFAGGNLQKFAADSGISLIETDQLIAVLRLHSRTAFPAADLRPLFATAGPIATVIADLQQKAQITQRHWQLVAEIVRLLTIFGRSDPPLMPTVGNLHAVLVARAISGSVRNIGPPSEQEVRDAVAFLASRSVGVLRVVDADTSGYRLAMSEITALRRLQAIDNTMSTLLKEDKAMEGQASVHRDVP